MFMGVNGIPPLEANVWIVKKPTISDNIVINPIT
jgi:hypothetical protein